MSNLDSALASILAENFMDDFSLFEGVASLFLNERDQLLTPLREAIEKQDRDMLKKSAHKLKGSVSYFHIPESRQLAYELEDLAPTISFTDANSKIDTLEKYVNQITEDLKVMLQMNNKKTA